MEKNKAAFILFFSAMVIGSVGRVYFPLALFVGFAPILAMLHIDHKGKYKNFDFVALLTLLAIQLIYCIWKEYSLLLGVFYAVLMWIPTFIYLFTNKHSKNNIGLLTLVIYWLAFEYVALKLSPDFAYMLLGTSFENTALAPWSGYSGLSGVTCWILIGNVLFYIALFKGGGLLDGKIRWITLCYMVILTALPIIFSAFINFEEITLTAETVHNLYSGEEVAISPYNTNGEIFSRSSAWVSVLIVIHALVKRRIK